MQMKIKDKEYKVKFGVGFVRKLDEKYFTESKSGVKFGMGMEVKTPMLLDRDVITLSEFLYEGTCAEESRPTQAEVDAYIDDHEDIEKLFDEVIEELKKHNATRIVVKKALDRLEKAKKLLEEKKEGTKNP